MRARAALLTRIGGNGPAKARRSHRTARPGLRVLAVGALATAVAAGVVLVQTAGGTDKQGRPRSALPGVSTVRIVNAADVLDQAAAVAGARPFTPPRPDQWVYIENKTTTPLNGPGGLATGGPLKTRNDETWHRADGQQSAAFDDKGKLGIQSIPPGATLRPRTDYPTLAALPTQPQALLAWVDTEMGGLEKADEESRRSEEFGVLNAILRDCLLPPGVEAAIYRAMGIIPGVTLDKDAVDPSGRHVLSVGRVEEGWLDEEVLFDPQTFRYVGERSIAINDHVAKGLDGTVHVKKGTIQVLATRIGAGIVDQPGRRPS